MTNARHPTPLRSWPLALACLPLVFLAGCPDDTAPTAAPGRTPANATAPTLAAPKQSGTAKPQPAAVAAAAPAQSQQQVAADGHAQKAQELINRAESSYRSGVTNYNANRLEAARLDFDLAVDTMLTSGMDLKNDPQLADEFDHLLSAINSLEMVALKQGNGFSPKVEDAPLDLANEEVTFPPDPALVGRIANQLKTTKSDLPLVVNEYVAGFIRYFSDSPTGHAHLKRSLERAGKYQQMIAKDLSDAGLPQDLIYLAVAESGFQPQVVNRGSGAGGMWQFMPFQGAYGLERNGYFDERFDPDKSSLAYARYMKYLYQQFGDWYLAMAAYNWGPGNVQRAVSRTGYADFWELYRRNALPTATKNYVPGIIAAAIMAKNPQQYGLTDLVPDAPVLSDTVTTTYAISLSLAADLTGSTVPAIVALNPALLRLETPRDIAYDLHLPAGTRQAFLDRLKEIPEENRASWRFHVVKNSETLDTIAAALHTRPDEIATYNEIKPGEPVEAGDELVVPVQPVSSMSGGEQRYKPRRGDTLITVADRFGVTVEQLRAWNHLSAGHLTPGHAIYVAEPVRLAPGMRSSHGHHVAGSSRGGAGTSSASASHHGASSQTHAANTPSSSHAGGKSAAAKPAHAAPAAKKKASR